jgi:hypothetical protein
MQDKAGEQKGEDQAKAKEKAAPAVKYIYFWRGERYYQESKEPITSGCPVYLDPVKLVPWHVCVGIRLHKTYYFFWCSNCSNLNIPATFEKNMLYLQPWAPPKILIFSGAQAWILFDKISKELMKSSTLGHTKKYNC